MIMFQPFISCERSFFIPTLLVLFPTLQHPCHAGLASACQQASNVRWEVTC